VKESNTQTSSLLKKKERQRTEEIGIQHLY